MTGKLAKHFVVLMGPSELTVAGVLALLALFPLSRAMDDTKKPAPEMVQMRQQYQMKQDCDGPNGPGPCIVDMHTEHQLGINPR